MQTKLSSLISKTHRSFAGVSFVGRREKGGMIGPVTGLTLLPNEVLLADQSRTRCRPVIEGCGGKRVTEWGVPDDVDPGDFFFSVIETALSLGANEIELTPAEEFGEVRVHFRIGSEFLAQAPLTPMQFGLLTILLPDASITGRDSSKQPVRIFRAPDGISYHLRFTRIRELDRSSAIVISLIAQPVDQPELVSCPINNLAFAAGQLAVFQGGASRTGTSDEHI